MSWAARCFLRALCALLPLVAGSGTSAQSADRLPRVGLVTIGGDLANQSFWAPFFERMRQHGYVEPRTVVYDRRFLAGQADTLDDAVADLVRAAPDVIVTTGSRETQAAMRATRKIPIVMFLVPDAVASGLATSLTQPGGNLTGLNTAGPEIAIKRLEVLRELVPTARRLAVLRSRNNPMPLPNWSAASSEAARLLGIEPIALFEADTPNGIDAVFADMRAAGIDAVSVFPSAEFMFYREDLAKAALRHGLPTIYDFREHAIAGGLAVYAARTEDLLARAADYAARLLKGASPSALPIELPTRFQLIINARTAHALGLQIPPSLLARADEVIE